jgi:hypothetical protein
LTLASKFLTLTVLSVFFRLIALAATVAIRRGLTSRVDGDFFGSAFEAPAAARSRGADLLAKTKGDAFRSSGPRSFFWTECPTSIGFWPAATPLSLPQQPPRRSVQGN